MTDILPQEARQCLRERFGHEGFRPGQEKVVLSALADRNVLAVMPTGSGKSLLYQLPAMMAEGLTLVISPLIALMKDQVDELRRKGLPATFINSSLSQDEQRDRIAACVRGETRLLYIAPERFQNAAFLGMLRQTRIARMAVDEAHCISEWGHDFRPDYRRLKAFRERVGNPLVSAFTATATPRVQRDIIESLGLRPEEVDVHVTGFDRPNLALSVVHEQTHERKIAFLEDFVRQETGSGIVYVGTRKKTDEIARCLREIDPSVIAYHGGLDPEPRARAQERFLSGKARIAVATIAFGMGIDKADIRFVVHFNYPGSVEQYYQEIGRAGRDGKPSRCVLLYSPEDRFLREFFIDLNYPPPSIVEAVYDTLWSLPENPVKRTYGQLAKFCGDIKEGHVGSAVRLLDGAGVTRALSAEAAASVTLARPGAEVLQDIRGKNQRAVFEALSVVGDLETPGRYQFHLSEISQAAGLDMERTRRALAALDAEGHIAYAPPFRGRGVEKLVAPAPPFERLPIDWDRQDMLRRAEEEKLQKMEEYMLLPGCRSAFILRYFGEKQSTRCGTCDACAPGSPIEGGEGVLARRPDVALPALVAVLRAPFKMGAGYVVEIVTGSRSTRVMKSRQNLNPAYNAAPVARDVVKAVVGDLVREGLLRQEMDNGYPVLSLTERGEQAARKAETEGIPEAKEPAALPIPPTGDAATAERAILECVAEVEPPLGVSKIAALVAGSKASWTERLNAARLSSYGAAGVTQEDAKRVAYDLLQRRLLRTAGSKNYPVLELTEKGREALAESGESLSAQAEDALGSVQARGASGMLDALLDDLLDSNRENALRKLEEVRLFHPREIVSRLEARYAASDGARMKTRVVWTAGEAGEDYAVSFLLRCVSDSQADTRRLAVSALAKLVGAGLCDPAQMEAMRKTLRSLQEDPNAQVRQYTARTLALLDASVEA